MGWWIDNVTAGDYKGANIKVKGLKNDKVILIHKTILGKKKILLNKNSVETVNVKNQSNSVGTSEFQVEIILKNGKKCFAFLSDYVYRKLLSSLY